MSAEAAQVGFLWTDLITPAVTIGGVWIAYWLHRKGVRKDLHREKAEQILSEVINVEMSLREMITSHKGYTRLYKDHKDLKLQLAMVKARIEVHFPKYLPPKNQDRREEDPDNIINCIDLLRDAIEMFTHDWGSEEAQILGGAKVQRRAKNELQQQISPLLDSLEKFRIDLRSTIWN
jgi:hypothetical protein